MRTVIGGVIGAAIAVVAWLGLEHLTHTHLGWLVCLVGLATGIGVSRASKSSAGSAIARGVLAIVITLAAILGGRQAYATLIQSGAFSSASKATVIKQEANKQQEAGESDASATEDTRAEDPRVAEAETSETEADDTGADESAEPGETPAEDVSAPPMPRELAKSAGPGAKIVPVKNYTTQFDTLWMCLAALAAYFTGKNSGSAKASTTSANDSEESAAESN